MNERDLAITVIVILCVLSVLTTPFMMISRGKAMPMRQPKSALKKAVIWASNITLLVLIVWLGYYLWF